MTIKYLSLVCVLLAGSFTAKSQQKEYNEPHRPQIHFSPRQNWMNDPNGMVYYKGTYHLFFQHNPESTGFGPIHWGHATSKDLVHWQQQPVALYPDSLGLIFSGSAIVDFNNTSGLGKNGKVALAAFFTSHNTKEEKAGKEDYENQSMAYSLDEGKTWQKYVGNPVLKNPGIKDFRDPKVSWYEAGKKWIMTLATKDRITFYSSKDLKSWTKESEFGQEVGAHGGVWEYPDLFALDYQGKKVWILLVSINPGGPNGGSATQYFTGDFDGKNFVPYQTDTRWINYGPDNYAGVTWSNTVNRRIFLAWMSNWQYGVMVPTQKWRSAMTVPVELGIKKLEDKYLLTSTPVKELNSIAGKAVLLQNIAAQDYDLSKNIGNLAGPARLTIDADKIESFSVTLSNASGEELIVGYDKASNNYFIDRTKSGKTDFEKGFAARHTAPRISTNDKLQLTLIIDNASVEMFADNGLLAMTAIFFPNENYSKIHLRSNEPLIIKTLQYNEMKSIWK